MPTRRPRALIANDPRVIESFTWACNDDYTETYFGKGVFATTAEARRAWPQYRRTIWARTHRMSLPRPAQVFDALTRHGWKTIWFSRNQTQFPTEEALVALEADRAAVVAFEQRDPTARRPSRTISGSGARTWTRWSGWRGRSTARRSISAGLVS